MNVFSKILMSEDERERRLGLPLKDEAAILRRQHRFAVATGGKGFRQPKKGGGVDASGHLRSERKALLRKRSRENTLAETEFRIRRRRDGWTERDINNAIEQRAHLAAII